MRHRLWWKDTGHCRWLPVLPVKLRSYDVKTGDILWECGRHDSQCGSNARYGI